MEPFFDGGLFEILIAAGFVLAVNFVFAKKYLLLIFSAVAVSAPLLLVLLHKSEWFYILAFVCFFNAGFLVVLLWKTKKEKPGEPLISFNYKALLKKTAYRLKLRHSSNP